MKQVYFENSYGDRRVIGTVESDDQAWQTISKFLKQHNYRAQYIISWTESDGTWYDVGSHSEFFIVSNS